MTDSVAAAGAATPATPLVDAPSVQTLTAQVWDLVSSSTALEDVFAGANVAVSTAFKANPLAFQAMLAGLGPLLNEASPQQLVRIAQIVGHAARIASKAPSSLVTVLLVALREASTPHRSHADVVAAAQELLEFVMSDDEVVSAVLAPAVDAFALVLPVASADALLERLLAAGKYVSVSRMYTRCFAHKDPVALVRLMVDRGDFAAAEKLLPQLPAAVASTAALVYVRTAITALRWTQAYRVAAEHGLTEMTDHITLMVRRCVMDRLVADGEVDLAAQLAGAHVPSQEVFVELLLQAGQPAGAAAAHTKFGLAWTDADFQAKSCSLRPLPLMKLTDSLTVVDTPELLLQMQKHFTQRLHDLKSPDALYVVGLDSEWRPVNTGRSAADWPVSIVQLADGHARFVLDMLVLRQRGVEFEPVLAWFLSHSRIAKVGVGVSNDVNRLLRTHPSLAAACSQVNSLIELSALVKSEEAAIGSSSLQGCVLHVLRKRLDKTQQCSDWQQRPLTIKQLRYAALDAVAALAVYKELTRKNTELRPTIESMVVAPMPSTLPAWAYLPNCHHLGPVGDGEAKVSADADVAPLSPADVERAVTHAGLPSERLLETGHSPSAVDAAHNLGVEVGQIINSLGFFIDASPILLLARGDTKVDVKKLATVFDVQKRKVTMAKREQCVPTWGYEPGAFPPCGLRTPMPVFLDEELRSMQGHVYCGGGSKNHMLRVTIDELLHVTGGSFIPVSMNAVDPDEDSSKTVEAINDLPLRFIVDNMLGRLARWLRVVGCDVEFVESKDAKLLLGRAIRERRVVVTRDVKLTQHLLVGPIHWVPTDEVRQQFDQICAHFNLEFTEEDLMSRCSACNSLGFRQLTAEEIAVNPQILPKVRSLVSEFWECYSCKKVYWEGPKFFNTREQFGALVSGQSVATTETDRTSVSATFSDSEQ